MRQSVVINLVDDGLIIGEIDQLPKPGDQFMILHDPRQRDGSVLTDLRQDVTTILIPWHRILFVQLIPETGTENVIGFVRE